MSENKKSVKETVVDFGKKHRKGIKIAGAVVGGLATLLGIAGVVDHVRYANKDVIFDGVDVIQTENEVIFTPSEDSDEGTEEE